MTQLWVWATADQFLGDFVLVWFSSFLGDFVQGLCWGILFCFSSFLKHDLFSGEYGQWPEFGQLPATLGSGWRQCLVAGEAPGILAFVWRGGVVYGLLGY